MQVDVWLGVVYLGFLLGNVVGDSEIVFGVVLIVGSSWGVKFFYIFVDYVVDIEMWCNGGD